MDGDADHQVVKEKAQTELDQRLSRFGESGEENWLGEVADYIRDNLGCCINFDMPVSE